MTRFRQVMVVVLVVALLAFWQLPTPTPGAAQAPASSPQDARSGNPPPAGARALPDFLPPEAGQTLRLIARGGPFPHRQDGQVFQNRERRLPARPRGHYREFTVATPRLDHRGPRRIVTGGDPPVEFWYSDDHYGSFRAFEPPR